MIGAGIGGYFFWKRRQNKSRGGSTGKWIDEAGNHTVHGPNSSGDVDGRGIDQPEQAKPSLLESVRSGLSALWCFGKRQDSKLKSSILKIKENNDISNFHIDTEGEEDIDGRNEKRSRYQGGSVGGSNSATTGYNEGEYNADFDQKSPGPPNPYGGLVSATRGSVSATPGANHVAELPGNTSRQQSTSFPQSGGNDGDYQNDNKRNDPSTVDSKKLGSLVASQANGYFQENSPYTSSANRGGRR